MERGAVRSIVVAAVIAVVGARSGMPDVAWAGDAPAPGVREQRDTVRRFGKAGEVDRATIARELGADAHAVWAAETALECAATAAEALRRAADERDRQGAKMYAYFTRNVARDFGNRSRYTDYRVMEIENRRLCGVVQEWSRTIAAVQEAGRAASARISADDPAELAAVADHTRRLVALTRDPASKAALLGALRGPALDLLVPDLHGWIGPLESRELATASMRLLALVPAKVDVARVRSCAEHVDPVVRRVAFRLLASVGSVDAIDLLVERVAVEEGVPLRDLVACLRAASGTSLGAEAQVWQEWWAAQRAGWQGGARVEPAFLELERTPYSRYFGLELTSARILFVIDCSGSMWEPLAGKTGESRMSAAAAELTAAVTQLDERTSFNVIAYGSSLERFDRRPVLATKENRERAARWIAKFEPDGQTNLAGSMLAAFEDTRPGPGLGDDRVADTIVVLSDGQPNCGPIAYDEDTLAELRRLNADGMVTVHTVFLGSDEGASFMRSLAEEHGGKFVHRKQ